MRNSHKTATVQGRGRGTTKKKYLIKSKNDAASEKVGVNSKKVSKFLTFPLKSMN